jgi:plasmid stabilization system protein ParE
MPSADKDMDDIEEYLSQYYASTVSRFFLDLEKKLTALADMPYGCPAYEEDPYFRKMVVNDYLLFYSVDEKRELLIIHRIFHHSRDIERLTADYRMPE